MKLYSSFFHRKMLMRVSSSKYLQLDTFCCKKCLKTQGSSAKVYFQINLRYFQFQPTTTRTRKPPNPASPERSWIIKVSHRLPASCLPPLATSCQPLFSAGQPNEQTRSATCERPSCLLMGRCKFCLWMKCWGKIQIAAWQTERVREDKVNKNTTKCGASHQKICT